MVQAEDLDRLTADLPPFAIVAYSFGALVAMRFAVQHPDRVEAMVLIEPPLITDDGTAWRDALEGRTDRACLAGMSDEAVTAAGDITEDIRAAARSLRAVLNPA